MALQEQYKQLCAADKVKVNSQVLKQLADADANPASFTVFDLEGNVVGVKGAAVILKLINQSMPQLTKLSFSGNNLASSSTDDMYRELVAHPNLRSINVSNNDIRLGGPSLVELVKKNKKLTEVNIDNTFLRPLFERLVGIHVQKNKEASGDVAPKKKKTAGFSFGEPDSDAPTDEAPFGTFSAGEGDDGGFGHVKFETGASGGKKVQRRATVCSEVHTDADIDNFVPDVIEKDPATREWLKQTLEKHDLFSHLEDFELLICVDAMMEVEKGAGDNIFEQGDEDGDLFYVIGDGEVTLSKDGAVTETLKKGDTTQDLMLMYASTYPVTATCAQDTKIYSIDRNTYRVAVAKASKKKRAMYEGFLSKVKFLSGLSKSELLQLADSLKPVQYADGEFMIKHGEVGEAFFIITEGVVQVVGRNEKNEKVDVCTFTVGENIGELEFLNNHKCVADCVAKGPLRAAKMNRHHFEMVMGPVKELLSRVAQESTVYEYYRETIARMNAADDEKKEDDA